MLGYVSTHFTNIFQGYLTRNEVIVIPDIGVFVVLVGGDVATDFIHIQRHCILLYILFVPLKAGRGISAETCGLDDVFPPDDLGSGPCTPFIIYIPHIIAAFLLIKIYSL